MKQAALSATRSLRSALDTRLLPSGSITSSGLGVPNLKSVYANQEDTSSLASRLSGRLSSNAVGSSVVPQPGGSRALSTRAKKRRSKKAESKRVEASGSKLRTTISKAKNSSTATSPQWTAVGAALSSLEESIARTNLLLHSLASGSAWARRTRPLSPRVKWSEKETSEPADTLASAQTTEALAALLQELGKKQAAAVNLLSRINKTTNTPPTTVSAIKTFEDVLVNNVGTKPDEVPGNTQTSYEKFDQLVTEAPSEILQGSIDPYVVTLESVVRDPKHDVPIPTLKHGLDRVLFNPGVHWLQDPHSRVYNFPPELQSMPAFTSFAYDRVGTFITSSKDTELADLARRQGKKYTGSTSSLSMILAHIYFLIGGWREVDLSVLSSSFSNMSKEFSAGQKMPYTFFMRQNDGVMAFDSGSQSENPVDQNVLSYIGVMLEKLLTLSKDEFDTLLRTNPEKLAEDNSPLRREAYRYSMSKSMVLRSQLDCADSRLPGTGVFDLKTRAAISVRQDVWNFEVWPSSFVLQTILNESFEREYYDLCRSAFLKYSFQVRIGAMDGVFVAYHNTSRMFGFQYIPLGEMDERLFGSHKAGESVFKACLAFLEIIADNITACFPGQDIKATVCTSESKEPELSVWVEPATWNEKTPVPVHEVRLKVSHSFNGERVQPGAQVSLEKDGWNIDYQVTRLAPSAETRSGRDNAFARQQSIRVACLPEGTTIKEFSQRMKDGVLEGYAPRIEPPEGVAAPATEGEGVAASSSSASSLADWNKRFRTQTTPLVNSLRILSRKGLEDMDRWTQEGSPKVLYKPRT
ncbi:Pet127-domain-containing protein [Ceratobasidium sp. AG-I]|nr:Pet127-domain-containing protein [Ceratobasidium sp. AG-I]